jgi:glucose/arabinose dehydrogenase
MLMRSRPVVTAAALAAAVAVGTVALTITPVAASSVGSVGAERSQVHAERGTGVRVVAVKKGLAGPSGFTFGPKGRIWYLERFSGRVRVLNRTTGFERTFFHISTVNGDGERGALGIALHPNYPAKPFVYVYVTRRQGGRLRNQLIRIRSERGKGVGFKVLLQSPVSSATNHNGGRIAFGPDGKLWVFDGENADPSNSQDRSHNLMGKVLRVNPDGSIPADNPFGSPIWSYGHRNSFGFAFDPRTGRLWETENGPLCNDEINLIVRGGNFAWGPNAECPVSPSPADTNQDGPTPRRFPKRVFASPIGITGAVFCERCGLSNGTEGDLVFGAVNDGVVRALDLNDARSGFDAAPRALVTASTGIHSMETGPGGSIYFSGPDGIYRLAPA